MFLRLEKIKEMDLAYKHKLQERYNMYNYLQYILMYFLFFYLEFLPKFFLDLLLYVMYCCHHLPLNLYHLPLKGQLLCVTL